MNRLLALLALLIPLCAPAWAAAHVTKPGYSEVRQHGSTVNYVLGLESDELVEIAGESKAELAAYMPGVVRLSVDGEACSSRMTRAEPERHNGTAYTRVWLFMECPKEQGQFRIDYTLPMDTVVDYELGGDKGLFFFDADHTVMHADSPGFPRFVEKGVEHIVFGWDHVVFLLILLLGARSLRDVIEFATVFTLAHSVTLALALLGVVNVPAAIVEPLIAASIVAVAILQVLGVESRRKLAVVFAFGLLHGLGFAGAVTFPNGTPIISALIGFNLGIELGQVMIVAVAFPILLGVRRFRWSGFAHAAAGSAAAAIGLFWLPQRVLGG